MTERFGRVTGPLGNPACEPIYLKRARRWPDSQAMVKIAPFGGKLKQDVMPAPGACACPWLVFTGNNLLDQSGQALDAIKTGVNKGIRRGQHQPNIRFDVDVVGSAFMAMSLWSSSDKKVGAADHAGVVRLLTGLSGFYARRLRGLANKILSMQTNAR